MVHALDGTGAAVAIQHLFLWSLVGVVVVLVRYLKGMSDPSRPWFLYLLECRSGAYYAGITNDLDARYAAHVAGRGAKFTRSNPPVRLIGARPFADRAQASRAEWAIKQLRRAQKPAYILGGNDQIPAYHS